MFKKKEPGPSANLEFWRGAMETRVSNIEQLCQGMDKNIEVIRVAIQTEKLTLAKFTTRVLAVAGIIMALVSFVLYVILPRLLDAWLKASLPSGTP